MEARMVRFRYRTPFGIPVTYQDATVALQALRAADRYTSVTRQAVIEALRSSLRDHGLLGVGGRWKLGDRDPSWFVAGDIAALRAIATQPLIVDAIRFRIRKGPEVAKVVSLADVGRLLRYPAPTSLLVDVYRAVPRFIPPSATAALLATRPPDPQDLAAVRLPAARTLVVFGADLSLDPRAYSWPEEAIRQLPHDHIAWEIATRGGAVSGVVLFADPNGVLQDECVWLLAANPNPKRTFPSSVDHLRTVMRGWPSQAQLGHLVDRAAAAVAGAAWKLPLSCPDNVGLPVGPHDARWDRLRTQQWFRHYERDGGAVQAWVLDLEETSVRAALTAPSASRAQARDLEGFGEFAQTPPRRHHNQQVIWIPPSTQEIPARPGTQQLALSQPPFALEEQTRGRPHHPSPGPTDPSRNQPEGRPPPPFGASSNGPLPPDADLDIDLP
jgi:hypothetical protein